MDMLSAVVFSSLLKSGLLSYGIDDPEKFLAAVHGDLLTIRLDQGGDRTMLVAGARDRQTLMELVKNRVGPNARRTQVGDIEILEDSKGEWGASLYKDRLVMGFPADVRHYVDPTSTNNALNEAEQGRKALFLPSSTSAGIVTYTDDSDRITSFISAALGILGNPNQQSNTVAAMIADLPYSATETTLGEHGFERVTKSPLGQFATVLPLLVPQKSPAPTKPTPAK
jgi:hypothetical protein